VKNDNYDIDDLIGKLLAGEATHEEQEIVQSWCNEQAGNQKHFDQARTIFESAARVNVEINFDADEAWQRMRTRLKRPARGAQVEFRFMNMWQVARIAAGMAVLAVASVWTYTWLQSPAPSVKVVAHASTAQDTLPDGSTAFLNKKSTISYQFDKKTQTRKVELKGEGFFEVKHEEERPFVIEAEEALVRDLGTAFNIKAYPDQDTIEVVVKEGVVQFYTANDPGINLQAGETGLYSKRSKSFTKLLRADTNVFAYKTGVFAFHATDLRSVIARVNEVYDARISLGNEKIGDCRLTVNFTNEELETIVDVIAETLALQVERKDEKRKEIILTGPGCQ
jgi:transmembrane sensor